MYGGENKTVQRESVASDLGQNDESGTVKLFNLGARDLTSPMAFSQMQKQY